MAKSEKPEKDPNDPAQMNRFRQIIVAYQRTHEYDKPLPFLLAGAFVLPIILGVVAGLVFGAL
ncbi:MAG: DUF4191 family protein, partial [Microlunatus sp.]|nr:DUF4191 family protein [Microlunatus sp.]